jgi:hypothetical protein
MQRDQTGEESLQEKQSKNADGYGAEGHQRTP